MIKAPLWRALLISGLFVVHAGAACGNCNVGKAFLRCSYYVEKKGDTSQKQTCHVYADALLDAENPGRASWYYILAGDFDQAIAAARKAIDRGQYYAFESLGEAWLLKGEEEFAKAPFQNLRKAVPGYRKLLSKHFLVLSRLYPKKWQNSKAESLLK